MNMHRYYQLKDLSECKWREAQEMVAREETRQARIRNHNHGTITKADLAEWERVLADAYELQQEAIQLEKEAKDARVEMLHDQWLVMMGDNNDLHELMQEQSELRGGI